MKKIAALVLVTVLALAIVTAVRVDNAQTASLGHLSSATRITPTASAAMPASSPKRNLVLVEFFAGY